MIHRIIALCAASVPFISALPNPNEPDPASHIVLRAPQSSGSPMPPEYVPVVKDLVCAKEVDGARWIPLSIMDDTTHAGFMPVVSVACDMAVEQAKADPNKKTFEITLDDYQPVEYPGVVWDSTHYQAWLSDGVAAKVTVKIDTATGPLDDNKCRTDIQTAFGINTQCYGGGRKDTLGGRFTAESGPSYDVWAAGK